SAQAERHEKVCDRSHSHQRRRIAPCPSPGCDLSPALDLDGELHLLVRPIVTCSPDSRIPYPNNSDFIYPLKLHSPSKWSRASAVPTSPAPDNGRWPPARFSFAADRPAAHARSTPGPSANDAALARRPRRPVDALPVHLPA